MRERDARSLQIKRALVPALKRRSGDTEARQQYRNPASDIRLSDIECESNATRDSAAGTVYVTLRGVDTEQISELIVERDAQREPRPTLVRTVLRQVLAADYATQRHLEISREELQNRDLAPAGPESRQAGPRGPVLFPTMGIPWARSYVTRLLPVQEAVPSPDQDRVLLGQGQNATRASSQRDLVALTLVLAPHGSENPPEASLVGEDHVTDPDVFDVLDAVSGHDLLSGEQATEDRLDPVLLARLVEVDRAEQVAVVGHGQRRHPHPGRLGEQVVDARGPVQHRVLGVDVEMYEAVLHAVPRLLGPSKFRPRRPRSNHDPQAVDHVSTGCGQNYTRVSRLPG